MTLCIAALCENRKTLILMADKMLGVGFIEAELAIEKIIQIHRNWWVMIAGNDISPVFDILDWSRKTLGEEDECDVERVMQVISDNYQKKRLDLIEALYLKTRGWTMEQFVAKGHNNLPPTVFVEIDQAVQQYKLDISLLVGGFDCNGVGHIFSVDNPGITRRHDIPGYYAIGNGMFGALYFMYYRELSAPMKASECLYYVYEGKIFGYQAGGIGEDTDCIIARHNKPELKLAAEAISTLDEMWVEFRPQLVKRLARLNPYVTLPRKKQKVARKTNLS